MLNCRKGQQISSNKKAEHRRVIQHGYYKASRWYGNAIQWDQYVNINDTEEKRLGKWSQREFMVNIKFLSNCAKNISEFSHAPTLQPSNLAKYVTFFSLACEEIRFSRLEWHFHSHCEKYKEKERWNEHSYNILIRTKYYMDIAMYLSSSTW